MTINISWMPEWLFKRLFRKQWESLDGRLALTGKSQVSGRLSWGPSYHITLVDERKRSNG